MLTLRLVEPTGYSVPGGLVTVTPDRETQARTELEALAVQHAAQWVDFGYHPGEYRILTDQNDQENRMTDQSQKTATITLDSANNDRQFPAYQLSINAQWDETSGHGYRLMGPKYLGRSRNLRTVKLDQRDADEIRAILNEVFPQETNQAVTLERVEAALLKTTDGTDVHDDFAIPAGEIRRILADLRQH